MSIYGFYVLCVGFSSHHAFRFHVFRFELFSQFRFGQVSLCFPFAFSFALSSAINKVEISLWCLHLGPLHFTGLPAQTWTVALCSSSQFHIKLIQSTSFTICLQKKLVSNTHTHTHSSPQNPFPYHRQTDGKTSHRHKDQS